MKIVKSKFDGVWFIEPNKIQDARGYFARTYCDRTFQKHELKTGFVQASTAYSKCKGTLRGLHYQRHPHWECKLVRCTRGSAYVVVVDLRIQSPTHRRWLGVELSAQNANALYVDEGFAQGYQTLCDDTELLYQMNKHYAPESAAGVAYDDPAFAIDWPLEPNSLSDKDSQWPAYKYRGS